MYGESCFVYCRTRYTCLGLVLAAVGGGGRRTRRDDPEAERMNHDTGSFAGNFVEQEP